MGFLLLICSLPLFLQIQYIEFSINGVLINKILLQIFPITAVITQIKIRELKIVQRNEKISV